MSKFLDLTELEYDLIESIRNYKRTQTNKWLLKSLKDMFNELLKAPLEDEQ